MEWVYSTKGKPKLSFEGYIYGFQKHLANGVSSYKCEMRRNHGGKAKVKIQDDQMVARLHEHTHAADGRKAEIMKVTHGIKRKAQETKETPQQILTCAAQQVIEEISTQLPLVRTIRGEIRKYHHNLSF